MNVKHLDSIVNKHYFLDSFGNNKRFFLTFFQDTTVVGIAITNPTNNILMLDVLLDVAVLSGEKSLLLQPKETVCYEVKYSPACTGSLKGR